MPDETDQAAVIAAVADDDAIDLKQQVMTPTAAVAAAPGYSANVLVDPVVVPAGERWTSPHCLVGYSTR